jgi:hypothetical protein
LWNKKDFVNGPLWFSQALLIFSSGYCALKYFKGKKFSPKPVTLLKGSHEGTGQLFPSHRVWWLSAFLVGLGALVVRQVIPVGENIFGLQIAYFSSYVFLFGVGISARRNDWLSGLMWSRVRPWVQLSLIVGPFMPIAIVAARVYQAPIGNFLGGFSVSTILYSFWEPFFAWGVIAGILFWFQNQSYRPSKFWSFLARGAYLVFIIHPLVLVGMSRVLQPWQAGAVLKFVVVGGLGCVVCWMMAGVLVKIPGIRKIV